MRTVRALYRVVDLMLFSDILDSLAYTKCDAVGVGFSLIVLCIAVCFSSNGIRGSRYDKTAGFILSLP